jgi:prepilin-type processing-associated H-X9-DG protein
MTFGNVARARARLASLCWVDVMHQTCIGSSWYAAESEAKSTAMLAFVDGHAKLEYADVSSADTLSARFGWR